jgi:hypothetical protein
MMLRAIYDEHLFSPQVSDAITSKEEARDYPLDRLNDMRAVINYAPTFAYQCTKYGKDVLRLAQDVRQMPGSRLFRINTALLLALGVMDALKLTPPPGLERLILDLTEHVRRRLESYPDLEGPPPGSVRKRWQPTDPEWHEATLFGVVLAELADRIGMGEQNLYSHAPHAHDVNGEICIARTFFAARQSFAFPHTVTLLTYVDESSGYKNVVPIFRGRGMTAITRRIKNGLTIFVDGKEVSDSQDLALMTKRVGKAFDSVCRREEVLSGRIDLDVRKMIIYSIELRELARFRREIWVMPASGYRTILEREITGALGLAENAGFARPMLELIEVGIDRVEQLA